MWTSIGPNHFDKVNSNLEYFLAGAIITFSMVTNAITTIMIAYKLWYVAVVRVHWIQWFTME